jgi:hypothetical protein
MKNIEIKAQPKIWRSGECIVGASGPVRLGNILRTLDILRSAATRAEANLTGSPTITHG